MATYTSPQQQQQSTTTTAADRRRRVILDLPDDFLRLEGSSSRNPSRVLAGLPSNVTPEQLATLDEQAAYALHHQLNSGGGGQHHGGHHGLFNAGAAVASGGGGGQNIRGRLLISVMQVNGIED